MSRRLSALLTEHCCVPSPSCRVRKVMAGDPLRQRGAITDYGHRLVPGVSVFVRYPRILSVVCAALDLGGDDQHRVRAVEAFFMWAWRHALGDDLRGFYTRGQSLAARFPPDGGWPSWQECSAAYVQNTYAYQVGYSLRRLDLAANKQLTPRGRRLAAGLFTAHGHLHRKLKCWLQVQGEPPGTTFLKRFSPGKELAPECLSPDERTLLRAALYGKDGEGRQRAALWKRMRRWTRKYVRTGGLLALARQAGTMGKPLSSLLPHLAGYEKMREFAVTVVVPRLLQLAQEGRQVTSVDEVRQLCTLARDVPGFKHEHHQASALRGACLSTRPVAELCKLTDGMCRLEGDRLRILDPARADHFAAMAAPEETEDQGNDDEEALRQVSLRSYQLWNLWNLGKHLEGE